MVSKHFLTRAALCLAVLLLATDANLFAGGRGGGGGGGGRGGGGGYGGGRGGGYGYGGGYGRGGFGYGGFYGGGFYGGGLFYGDYNTGGGYPGYYAPYAYPAPSYYYADPYYAPRISSAQSTAPATSYYYAPSGTASSVPAASNAASIHVVLPDPQATVLFDGRATTSTGADRYYHSPELAPGGSYKYQLRVTWTQDGRQVTQDRTVAVTPGQTTDVVFARVPSEGLPSVTTVK
jgi:uncharacterized protein (TIGR03000 family)